MKNRAIAILILMSMLASLAACGKESTSEITDVSGDSEAASTDSLYDKKLLSLR